jgi:acyl-CoA thioester hydrolase
MTTAMPASSPNNRGQVAVAPTSALPVQGEIRLRPRYCECDPMGVAHHAAYAPWLEMARTEMLRDGGVTYAQLEAAGVFLVVTKMEIKYRRPAMYDQEIIVRTRVTGGGRARIDHAYDILEVRGDGSIGGVLASATTTLACVDGDGRPRALPDWLTPGAHQ